LNPDRPSGKPVARRGRSLCRRPTPASGRTGRGCRAHRPRSACTSTRSGASRAGCAPSTRRSAASRTWAWCRASVPGGAGRSARVARQAHPAGDAERLRPRCAPSSAGWRSRATRWPHTSWRCSGCGGLEGADLVPRHTAARDPRRLHPRLPQEAPVERRRYLLRSWFEAGAVAPSRAGLPAELEFRTKHELRSRGTGAGTTTWPWSWWPWPSQADPEAGGGEKTCTSACRRSASCWKPCCHGPGGRPRSHRGGFGISSVGNAPLALLTADAGCV